MSNVKIIHTNRTDIVLDYCKMNEYSNMYKAHFSRPVAKLDFGKL